MNYIEIKAPAKINIGLSILSKREDSFHNLSTLFYPISDLFDILIFEQANHFEFYCNSDLIPKDHSNIVVKAKNLLEEVSGKIIRVKIELKKFIPSQAGLGGGSSDAAATLISLNEMFRLKLNHEKLIALALELGSDVPFFIKSKPAIGTSRGEILNYVDFEITEPILIINPGINISTKEAFQNISPINFQFDFNSIVKEGKINYNIIKEVIKNDFEKYVFEKFPVIEEIKNKLYEYGAFFALLSGSGSTVYGIFPNLKLAEKAKAKMSKEYFSFLSNPLS
ncbi:MAG: 4-(cytidine 5'-diphospho)-2-C-methyl-D-erythritol kinase [Ignavibacteriales bacterium]|nr:4-(cytidine 5'-diphospho)-2-C-methyl-D-erythritol kinase [Ignavibacteriales bacterium]